MKKNYPYLFSTLKDSNKPEAELERKKEITEIRKKFPKDSTIRKKAEEIFQSRRTLSLRI